MLDAKGRTERARTAANTRWAERQQANRDEHARQVARDWPLLSEAVKADLALLIQPDTGNGAST
jgi:hypothetical protein